MLPDVTLSRNVMENDQFFSHFGDFFPQKQGIVDRNNFFWYMCETWHEKKGRVEQIPSRTFWNQED